MSDAALVDALEIDAAAKALGFEGAREMFDLVAAADFSTPEAIEAFGRWKTEDGSKAGLLALGAGTSAFIAPCGLMGVDGIDCKCSICMVAPERSS